MDKKLKEKLKQMFCAPEPIKKKSFLKNIRQREISMFQMICQQFFYLRKTIWLLVIGVCVVAFFGVSTMNNNTVLVISSLSPLAAGLACLEMYRSYRYGMTELELATRFSLKSVFFSRMLIIGIVYLAAFVIITPVMSVRFGTDIFSIALRILVPYLMSTSLCLHVERTKLGRKTPQISMLIACVISISVFVFKNNQLFGLHTSESFLLYMPQWKFVILFSLIILTIYENYKTLNTMEDFVCI